MTGTTVHDVLDTWSSAEQSGDVATLGTLLAPDFAAIGPLGFTLPREAWLERHATGALTYESFTLADVEVRSYGAAAVVTGREIVKGAYGGHAIPAENRFTLVLDSSSGPYRLVACHMSFVAGTDGAPPLPGRG